MTELIDKVREALIALAYQESVELYHDPEFKEKLMPLFLETAKNLAKMTVEDEDDLDDSDLDEQTRLMLKELEESIFGSEDQIRDMSFQQAKNTFTTKSVLTAGLMNCTRPPCSFCLKKSTAGMNKEERSPASTVRH